MLRSPLIVKIGVTVKLIFFQVILDPATGMKRRIQLFDDKFARRLRRSDFHLSLTEVCFFLALVFLLVQQHALHVFFPIFGSFEG